MTFSATLQTYPLVPIKSASSLIRESELVHPLQLILQHSDCFSASDSPICHSSGSSRLVVNHAKYHPERSPTSRNLHRQVSNQYLGGVGGTIDLYRDDVSLGGLRVKQVNVGRYMELSAGEPEPAPDVLGLNPPYGADMSDYDLLVRTERQRRRRRDVRILHCPLLDPSPAGNHGFTAFAYDGRLHFRLERS